MIRILNEDTVPSAVLYLETAQVHPVGRDLDRIGIAGPGTVDDAGSGAVPDQCQHLVYLEVLVVGAGPDKDSVTCGRVVDGGLDGGEMTIAISIYNYGAW